MGTYDPAAEALKFAPTVKKLRKDDVIALVKNAPPEHREAVADYIRSQRGDANQWITRAEDDIETERRAAADAPAVAAKAAASAATAASLPPLQGVSEKQVGYATKVRAGVLEDIDRRTAQVDAYLSDSDTPTPDNARRYEATKALLVQARHVYATHTSANFVLDTGSGGQGVRNILRGLFGPLPVAGARGQEGMHMRVAEVAAQHGVHRPTLTTYQSMMLGLDGVYDPAVKEGK